MGHDAFLSYSHAADDLLAPRLQEGLQRFGKPWYRRRELSVFRDRTGLSANPGLWSSIVEALDDSDWFVLLASPESAESAWVNREAEHWLAARGTAQMLVVLTEGTWIWDDRAGDFAAASTAVPAALAGAFTEEPYHLDLTWARGETQVDPRDGRFRDAVATLAAAIRGVPKDELVGADVREHRRTLRTAWAAAALLFLLTLFSGGAAVAAVRSADQVRDEQAQTESARGEADRQAALASAAATEAQTNAAEARANADRAKASADEAAAQRSEAESNAAEADANADEAERNAAAADANAGEAEANAALARQNQSLAEANASEAQDAEARALDSASAADDQRNRAVESEAAALAAEQEAAANAANAEHQRQLAEAAAASLSQANDELAAQQQALLAANDQLTATNDALGEANSALSEQNATLESSRLTALSTQARERGILDLAMLLAVEAHRADPSNNAARDALASIEADSGYLDHYLPGNGIVARWTPLVQGRTVVAAYGDDVAQPLRLAAWDLDRPDDPPLRIDASRAGTESLEIWSAFVLDGGHRLVAPVRLADFRRAIVMWDLTTGAELFRSAPTFSPLAVRSPSGDHLVVTEESQVVLVDVATGARRASWTGSLASASAMFGCGGEQSGPTTTSQLSPTTCDWSPDGRRILAWSPVHAAWVLWSVDDPSSVTVLGTPPAGSTAAPRFLPGPSIRVAVALAPGAVSLVDGTGALITTYAVPAVGGVVALGTAPDRLAVADATRGVWSIDTSSGVVPARRDVSGLCEPPTAVRYSEAGRYVIVTSMCGEGFPQYAYLPATSGEAEVRPMNVAPISFYDDDRQIAESVENRLQARYLAGSVTQSLDRSGCRVHLTGLVLICDDGLLLRSPTGWTDARLTSAPFTFANTGGAFFEAFAVMPGGRVALFDLTRSPVGTATPLTELPGRDAELAPDGSRYVILDATTATVVDRATGDHRTIEDLAPYSSAPTFTPDSRRLLVRSYGLPVTVYDPADASRVGELAQRVEPSPDGEVLATWDPDATEIELRSADDLSSRGSVALGGRHPRSVAVGPEGRWLALIDGSDLVVLDATTGGVVATAPGRFPGSVVEERMAASPDGSRLVVTSDGTSAIAVSLWDTSAWREVASEPSAADPYCADYFGMQDALTRFSPDGDLVVVAGQILSLDGLAPVGGQVGCNFVAGDRFRSAAFAADGSSVELLVTRPGVYPDSVLTAALVPLGGSALADEACADVGRNLSVTERSRYLAGAGESTCPRWPAA